MTLLVLLLLDLRTVAHSDLGDGMVIDHRSLDEQANGNKPRAGSDVVASAAGSRVVNGAACPDSHIGVPSRDPPPETQVQHATED